MLRRMATDVKAGTVSVKPHVVEVTIPATRDAVTGESMPERVAQERREGFVAEMQIRLRIQHYTEKRSEPVIG
jgi:hypothetical protein